jgi:hypothetical protein
LFGVLLRQGKLFLDIKTLSFFLLASDRQSKLKRIELFGERTLFEKPFDLSARESLFFVVVLGCLFSAVLEVHF